MTNNQTQLNMIVEVDAMSMYIARLKQQIQAREDRHINLRPTLQQNFVKVKIEDQVATYIKQWVDINQPGNIVINETVFSNKKGRDGAFTDDTSCKNIVALNRLNDIRYINKYLESLNKKLPVGGKIIGCVETSGYRKKQIMESMPAPFNKMYYALFYLFKRVCPKIPHLKEWYFRCTRGKRRVLSKIEAIGRLYSCGYRLVDTKEIGNQLFFVAEKTGMPAYNETPTYGPLIHLKRVGYKGKLIKVYKLRSMYPYSEYLQQYIFETQGLQEGGKFKNDPRVSTIGKFLRKFWLDELPMLINIVKGDLKIVGVRPVSENYLKNVYPADFLEYRKKFKPGFIPPFYVDLPKTSEELIDSERRYLEAYEKQPLKTDIEYMIKALSNVLFKKARSN